MWRMILVVASPCVFLRRTWWGTLSACSTTWWPTWETGWRICTETLWVYSCYDILSPLFVLLLSRAAVRRVVPKVCKTVCVCFRRACPQIRTHTRFTLRQSWLTQRLEMSLPKCFRRAHQRAVLPEGWVWHHMYLWRWIVISENKILTPKHTHISAPTLILLNMDICHDMLAGGSNWCKAVVKKTQDWGLVPKTTYTPLFVCIYSARGTSGNYKVK